MILKNHKKNKKFRFDKENFDFGWEISLGNSVKTQNHDYKNLLRDNYNYNPNLHEFDVDKFRVKDK